MRRGVCSSAGRLLLAQVQVAWFPDPVAPSIHRFALYQHDSKRLACLHITSKRTHMQVLAQFLTIDYSSASMACAEHPCKRIHTHTLPNCQTAKLFQGLLQHGDHQRRVFCWCQAGACGSRVRRRAHAALGTQDRQAMGPETGLLVCMSGCIVMRAVKICVRSVPACICMRAFPRRQKPPCYSMVAMLLCQPSNIHETFMLS